VTGSGVEWLHAHNVAAISKGINIRKPVAVGRYLGPIKNSEYYAATPW
jgi:hypothetical protein